MTTPTPAQIEALLEIRDWTLKQPDTVWYDQITTLHDLCEQALTAAAQVAEPDQITELLKKSTELQNLTIERCAQRLENLVVKYRGTEPVELVEGKGEPISQLFAAAIRKLKDET